ncbi:MAG: ATP-binding protein [Bacillota bacterium]
MGKQGRAVRWYRSIQIKVVAIYLLLILAAMQCIGVYLWLNLEQFYNEQNTKTLEQAVRNVAWSARQYLVKERQLQQLQQEIEALKKTPPSGSDQQARDQKLLITRRENSGVELAAEVQGLQSALIDRVRSYEPQEADAKGDTIQLAVLDSALKPVAKSVGLSFLDTVDLSLLTTAVQTGANRELKAQFQRPGQEQMQDIKVLAIPIKQDDTVYGLIYVESGLVGVRTNLEHFRDIVYWATGGALLIVTILGSYLASTIAVPIKQLTNRAANLAQGDFSQLIHVRADDEIGQLGDTFNLLTLRLRETLAQIANEKGKMEAMLEYMAEGVIALDSAGGIIHANPAAQAMFGVSASVLGQPLDQVFDPKQHNFGWRQALASNQTITKQLSLPGSPARVVRSHAAPFTHPESGQAGIVIVLYDITEQERLEELRRDFVANVSHELRTPLTTIKSYVETILDGAVDSPELTSRFLGVVRDETDRMTRLVADLLQLAQLDAISKRERFFIQSIKDMVRDVTSKLAVAFEQKGLGFSLALPESSPMIYAAQDKIQQVLINILSNAIKYTPEGGQVFMSLTELTDGVEVVVQDTGIGIPKEDLPRIFERFYRVDKARSRELGGTGLGLSIARQIVENHGGRIRIESEVGQGTAVRIWLPRPEAVSEAAAAEADPT